MRTRPYPIGDEHFCRDPSSTILSTYRRSLTVPSAPPNYMKHQIWNTSNQVYFVHHSVAKGSALLEVNEYYSMSSCAYRLWKTAWSTSCAGSIFIGEVKGVKCCAKKSQRKKASALLFLQPHFTYFSAPPEINCYITLVKKVTTLTLRLRNKGPNSTNREHGNNRECALEPR